MTRVSLSDGSQIRKVPPPLPHSSIRLSVALQPRLTPNFWPEAFCHIAAVELVSTFLTQTIFSVQPKRGERKTSQRAISLSLSLCSSVCRSNLDDMRTTLAAFTNEHKLKREQGKPASLQPRERDVALKMEDTWRHNNPTDPLISLFLSPVMSKPPAPGVFAPLESMQRGNLSRRNSGTAAVSNLLETTVTSPLTFVYSKVYFSWCLIWYHSSHYCEIPLQVYIYIYEIIIDLVVKKAALKL